LDDEEIRGLGGGGFGGGFEGDDYFV